MVKAVPTQLRNHIDQEVTALCTCWLITRVDGTQYRFTDSDEDVVEGGQTYQSIGAYKRTAIESTSTLSVDNLEVVGIASDLVLPERSLQAGLFDGADVRIFITSWQNGIRGELKMRRGFFGEVQVMPNGTYQVELRGLLQRLSYTYTDLYLPICRLDLGEPTCGIRIPAGQVKRSTAYAVGDTVVAPNTSALQNYVGDYKRIGLGDPNFEIAGVAGDFTGSAYWRNTGTVDATISTNAKAGSYAAQGDAGAQLTQDIDIIATSGIPEDNIDYSGQKTGATQIPSTVNLYAWRRDTAGTGQLSLRFLDAKMREVGFGRAVNASATKMTPSVSIPLNGDFTIEGWVWLNAGSTASNAGFGGFGTSTNSNAAGAHADIRFDPPRLFYNPDLNNINTSYGTSNMSLGTNRWYHVAVSRRVSDGQVTTYIDGIQRGQSTGFVDSFRLDFILSTISGTTDATYQDVRIWNTVRTQYEIASNKDFTLNGTEAGLIHYWRINNSDGSATTGTETITTGSNTFVTTPSPIAVSSAHTPNNALQQTAAENVGASWVLRSFTNVVIPHGARYMRVRFDTTSTGNFLDSMFGWTVNSDTVSTGTIPSILGQNTQYICTTAGTTAATMPVYGGSSVTDGGAVFSKDTNPFTREGIVTESDGARVFRAVVSEPRAVDAWFNGGLVTFETGDNAGVSIEVKDWTQSNSQIELFLSLPFNIQPGDLFRIYPGCDKSRISCAAIFNNILQFRGFPDVPGQDDLYRYPDAR